MQVRFKKMVANLGSRVAPFGHIADVKQTGVNVFGILFALLQLAFQIWR